MAAKVEIEGMDKLKAAFRNLPNSVTPALYREIAKKPASRGASIAKQLQPIGDTGATARTIGILRTRNARQTYVEVGYRGRSLGHIYLSKDVIRRRNRGSVRGFPWLFDKAGSQIATSAKREMKVDITKVLVRSLKRNLA